MTRTGAVGALVALLLVVTGCSAGKAPAGVVLPPTAPVSAAAVTPPGVAVVPASSHVTGYPYPAHCVARAGGQLPDLGCTPGAIRSDIDPAHLDRNVCLKGWSGSVRPPKAETDQLKTQAMRAYGVPASQRSTTELDHYVPESWGGASDVKNLWPQRSDLPHQGVRNSKDAAEDTIHAWICDGHQAQWAAAVEAFVTDWRTAKTKLGIK